ncbi:MAG TPA: protein kinase [Gemmataceae bacterium]|jgi:serine/threonine protein kinase
MYLKKPHVEPIPGYRLLGPLGKGGFGEVWKCEAPGGLFKAIKFVYGDRLTDPTGAGVQQELRALQLIKSVRHPFLRLCNEIPENGKRAKMGSYLAKPDYRIPELRCKAPFLLSIERIEIIDGEAIIVMELADRSLHDLLTEYQAAGKAGIPRAELLSYLREAAEALDVLNQEHGLQHLDIKPRNLFLIGRHVKVADFGLVTSLSDLQNPSSWMRRSEAVTPLYAAPESFLGRFTLFSDQYSLAVTYQELRTGGLPFTGRNYRQLALRHVQDPPDLERLPEAERPILARALAKEPRQRYPSCCAFVQALRTLGDVPMLRPERSQRTSSDLNLGEMAATPAGREAPVRSAAPAAVVAPFTADTPSDVDSFLADYQLLECLHRHAAVEVWKAQTSDGRKRLVKLVNGFNAEEERPGGDPLARLRDLRHPCLPTLNLQIGFGSRLALIVDAPDASLADRLRECRQLGQPGVPRPELLVYLRQAAEALDALYQQHRLQHLCLSPRQLVLRGGRLYLLDFALVELLWLPAGHQPAALNTRYAAPELFDRQFSRHADQYSLALIYQELLTGIHPFRNLNQRQMALAKLRGKPDLAMLPAANRPVVAQALHIDPDQRFPTCSAFVEALAGVTEGRAGSSHSSTKVRIVTVSVPLPSKERRPPSAAQVDVPEMCWDRSPVEMKQIIAEQVAAAAGDWEVRERGPLRYRFHRGRRGGNEASRPRVVESATPTLEHFACGRLLPATVPLKLSGFVQEWKIQPVEFAQETVDLQDGSIRTASWQYLLHLDSTLWQRWRGRSPGLLVRIDLSMPRASTESLADVVLRVLPRDCSPPRGIELLEELGPRLMHSLRDHLQLPPDRRSDERIAWVENVRIQPVYSEREIGEAFAAQTRDISEGGIGLELPCRPPCDFLLAQICPPHRAPLIVPLQGLHAQPRGDGRHFVGARFAWELIEECRS